MVLILDNDLATDVTDGEGNRFNITTIAAPSSESDSGARLRPQYGTNLDEAAPEGSKTVILEVMCLPSIPVSVRCLYQFCRQVSSH